MNPYETPPSSLKSSRPGLLPRATNLRSFCGKLAWAGVIIAAVFIGLSFLAPVDSDELMIAGWIALVGMITAIVSVAWAWIAILLKAIGRSRNR